MPNNIVGVPGAERLAKEVGRMLGIKVRRMKKDKRTMPLFLSSIKETEKRTMIIGAQYTNKSEFAEKIKSITEKQPDAKIINLFPVIVNRGKPGLFEIEQMMINSEKPENIFVKESNILVLPLLEFQTNDWAEEECQLCKISECTTFEEILQLELQ
jgi:hypothetical protein